MSGVLNFRDLAGGGLPLSGGAVMATGVVFRSGFLSDATSADLAALKRIGITEILDLRTPAVARKLPDPTVAGARYRLINLYAVESRTMPRFDSVGQARAYMRSVNVGFVADPAQRKRVAQTITAIAQAHGPVLVHCTEGKDRTGWIAAVVQLAVGADAERVYQEYLRSNTERSHFIEQAYRRTVARSGEAAAKVQRATLEVESGYLRAGLDEINRRYGTLEGYLRDGLGLSGDVLDRLRQRLRVG